MKMNMAKAAIVPNLLSVLLVSSLLAPSHGHTAPIRAMTVQPGGSLVIETQGGFGRRFQILREFHQPAAPNVERSDITIIRCQNREYYIYRYYRRSGPNYRAIIPGRWGNALGGRDHWTFDEAAGAACNW